MEKRYGVPVESFERSLPQSNQSLNAADFQAGATENSPAKTEDLTSVLPGLILFSAADSASQRNNLHSDHQAELSAIGVAHDRIQNQE